MKVNKFISDFQFLGSSIREISLKNNFIAIDDRGQYKRSIDVDYDIDSIYQDEDDNSFTGLMTLHVKVKISDAENSLAIKMSIQGCFAAPEGIGAETFQNMLSLNGCTTLFSVSRATIMSLSSQSFASGNVILPMVNVFKLNEKKQKEVRKGETDKVVKE